MAQRDTDYFSESQAGFRKGRSCRDNIMILAQLIGFVLDEKRVHKLRKEQSQSDIPKEEVNRSNCRNNRSTRELRSGRQAEEKSAGEAKWKKSRWPQVAIYHFAIPLFVGHKRIVRGNLPEKVKLTEVWQRPETSNWTQMLRHLRHLRIHY